MATSIRIEAGTWCAIRPIEKDGLKIFKDEIRAGGIGNGSTWLGGKSEIESVNPWLYIQSAFGVPEFSSKPGLEYDGIAACNMSYALGYLPASVWQCVKFTGIAAISILPPPGPIDSDSTAKTAHGITILITCIVGDESISSKFFVSVYLSVACCLIDKGRGGGDGCNCNHTKDNSSNHLKKHD
jgi:hypothetical protein